MPATWSIRVVPEVKRPFQNGWGGRNISPYYTGGYEFVLLQTTRPQSQGESYNFKITDYILRLQIIKITDFITLFICKLL